MVSPCSSGRLPVRGKMDNPPVAPKPSLTPEQLIFRVRERPDFQSLKSNPSPSSICGIYAYIGLPGQPPTDLYGLPPVPWFVVSFWFRPRMVLKQSRTLKIHPRKNPSSFRKLPVPVMCCLHCSCRGSVGPTIGAGTVERDRVGLDRCGITCR